MGARELAMEIQMAAEKRMREANERARSEGIDFRPVADAEGIRVGDVVTIGQAKSRYEVKRIDPQLSDPFDAASELVFMAGVRGLSGPFEKVVRRIPARALRKAE